MKKIVQYLKDYFIETDKKIFFLSTVFIAIAIFINYYTGLEKKLRTIGEIPQHVSWFLIFLCSLSFPYLLQAVRTKQVTFNNKQFLFLLIAAPGIFAWKNLSQLLFTFYEQCIRKQLLEYGCLLAIKTSCGSISFKSYMDVLR